MNDKKYNLINNICGWVVFLIALATYWLTLEPTASYWDCGEFIIQADKLEVGHPPGNPIFMLTARFFANFAPDFLKISVMVNAMSGLLSALTILLLFWTITHLVSRLIPHIEALTTSNPITEGKSSSISSTNSSLKDLSLSRLLIIMGCGVCGALAYCWSDTFWFSAVEGEVYAFSSFCTALVFWLILKWESRADEPGADKYLVLIAYIIGVSIAVHLLNLLCIPAIVLVFAYRKFKNVNLWKSLLALGVSFLIVFLVLYGLVPGFIKVAQQFELLFVNSFHFPFNSGALAYGLTTLIVFSLTLWLMARPGFSAIARIGFLISVTISGMLFFGSGTWLGWMLTAILGVLLFLPKTARWFSPRVMSVIMWSIAVIFIGYSSYALILIRSSASTPMNQNAPDNVFDLASYLNREQYGETPLLYGQTLYSSPMKTLEGYSSETLGRTEDGEEVTMNYPVYGSSVVKSGKKMYAKGVSGATPHSEYDLLTQKEKDSNAASATRGGDYYVVSDHKPEVTMNPELNSLFPRLYSRAHAAAYQDWVRLDTLPSQLVTVTALDADGRRVPELNTQAEPSYNQYSGQFFLPEKQVFKPSFTQNLAYFFNYQLSHMYLRYFMWNFAGRQNDVNNQYGELDAGNWISGLPFIDNPRLGDQSLLPDDLSKNNKGNNKYYLLPLILGLIGIVWQSFRGTRGIEQFWVVFFLFFMTGIAIVLYLNQTPGQPRERDYSFAGSFYAYAIWIGMGVAGIWQLLMMAFKRPLPRKELYLAAVSALIGLAIPLQMLSQTYDDHDRSGRYAARDYAVNYLESLEPDAIVFCNGDNDTFPLWYAQEVEGVRPDVRIINLSYLNSDWYANQQRIQSYDGRPVEFTATPSQIAYGNQDVTTLPFAADPIPADLLSSLKILYSGKSTDPQYGYRMLPSAIVTIPIDKKKVLERGLVAPQDSARILPEIRIDLSQTQSYRSKGYLGLGEILMLDIIATNAAQGWPRPIYWCATVGDEYHTGLTPYLRLTGMTHQLVPTAQEGKIPRTDRILDVINNKYRWGWNVGSSQLPYFDETARRMLFTVRNSMVETASELIYEGDQLAQKGDKKGADEKYRQAVKMIDKMLANTPAQLAPYDLSLSLTIGQILCEAGISLGDPKLKKRGLDYLQSLLVKNMQYLKYNADIVNRFGHSSMTYDSRLMPYQYWRIIELFRQYGGSEKELKQILEQGGVNEQQLKRQYDYAYNPEAAAKEDPTSGISPRELAEETARYCEIANELATKDAAGYAAASSDERYIDSMLYYVIETVKENPEAMKLLETNEQFRNLDQERSQRLWQQFQRNHPDL